MRTSLTLTSGGKLAVAEPVEDILRMAAAIPKAVYVGAFMKLHRPAGGVLYVKAIEIEVMEEYDDGR